VRGSRLPGSRFLGLAASVLLATSLALAGGFLVQSGRIRRLEADGAATEAALRAEVDALSEAQRRAAESHRLEVERLAREKAAAEAAAERQPASPEAASEPRPLVNVPFLWLRPEGDATRGEPQAAELSSTAELVVLILPIDEPGPFERFRLEVLSDDGARRVWQTDELVKTGLAETSVALPRSLLPPGGYSLRLSGLGQGQTRPLATYRLRIAAR
jgi:hypothetical protein